MMTTPTEPNVQPAPTRGPARRIAAALTVGVLLILVLWITAFSLVTSLLIGSGVVVVFVAASTVSDAVEMILNTVAAVISLVLGAIAAIFGTIFGLCTI
jgi:hypothetical protein